MLTTKGDGPEYGLGCDRAHERATRRPRRGGYSWICYGGQKQVKASSRWRRCAQPRTGTGPPENLPRASRARVGAGKLESPWMALGIVPKPPGLEGRRPGVKCAFGLGLSQVLPCPSQDLHPPARSPLQLGTDSPCDRVTAVSAPGRPRFLTATSEHRGRQGQTVAL